MAEQVLAEKLTLDTGKVVYEMRASWQEEDHQIVFEIAWQASDWKVGGDFYKKEIPVKGEGKDDYSLQVSISKLLGEEEYWGAGVVDYNGVFLSLSIDLLKDNQVIPCQVDWRRDERRHQREALPEKKSEGQAFRIDASGVFRAYYVFLIKPLN